LKIPFFSGFGPVCKTYREIGFKKIISLGIWKKHIGLQNNSVVKIACIIAHKEIM